MLKENIEVPDEEEPIEIEQEVFEQEPVKQETVPQNENDGKQEEEYGRKVSKRINKLVAERNRGYDERDHEIEENRILKERLEELETNNRETNNKSISEKIEYLKKRKIELLEEADYEGSAKIDDDLIDLKIELKSSDIRTQIEPVQKTVNTPAPKTPQAQEDWLSDHGFFENKDSEFKTANDIYLAMVNNEGYDPSDKDTYTELDARINRAPQKREVPPPTIPPDRGANVGQANDSNSLNNNDIRRMREFGLDPNNGSHRESWLKNKRGK